MKWLAKRPPARVESLNDFVSLVLRRQQNDVDVRLQTEWHHGLLRGWVIGIGRHEARAAALDHVEEHFPV